jgi:Na+/proline symporter
LSFVVILSKIPGGWAHAAAVAGAAHKFTVFDFRFSFDADFFSRPYSFWAGVAGGCFLTTATHGTDQLMVQRLLSARDERESRRALFASWVVILVQFLLFLMIGALLFVYYSDTHLTPPAQRDRMYPEFVWNNLPPGLAGLVMAAILAAAMANLSAALNSLSSTVVVDFFHAQSLGMARWATVAWGGVLLAIAIGASGSTSVLQAGLSIGSIPAGALLGVFLLGTLTKRPGERAAIAGVVAGLGTVLYVVLRTHIAFTWYVLIGTAATFLVGLGASAFERDAAGQAQRGN